MLFPSRGHTHDLQKSAARGFGFLDVFLISDIWRFCLQCFQRIDLYVLTTGPFKDSDGESIHHSLNNDGVSLLISLSICHRIKPSWLFCRFCLKNEKRIGV